MNLFDIIGPVMVGPSSSHTAGAVKIGYVSRKLMAQPIVKAKILLYGSFLATGKGHGTQLAIVAGLLGMKEDDSRIPNSLEIAKEKGMEVFFGEANLKEGHPNSVELILTGENGKELEIVGESLGGSRINIAKIDGHIRLLKDLRLPTIVACHFGAFEKFPTQKVNGSTQTKYDVPYYKYVGAHVNGNLISSSAIAFRLLFAIILFKTSGVINILSDIWIFSAVVFLKIIFINSII